MADELPEESLEELYENAPCGYLTTLPNGTIRKVNQTLLSWTGYSRSELLAGKRFQELLTVPGRIYHDTHYGPLLQMQGFVNEVAFNLHCPNRDALPVLVNAIQVSNAEGKPLLNRVTIVDATARRKYEQELLHARRKADRLAMIVRASGDAILHIDPQGRIETWNWGAEQMFGYTQTEAVGSYFSELITPVDQPDPLETLLKKSSPRETKQVETTYLNKVGQQVHVSISVTPHFVAVEGLVSVSLIIRDITERKQAELALLQLSTTLEQRVQERTRELERSNQDLDQFAYVASHDLKAPLCGIRMLADWVQEDAGEFLPQQSQRHLHNLQSRVDRLDQLLEDLLAYSRVGRKNYQLKRVDVSLLLQEAIELLAPPPGFQIITETEMPVFVTRQAPLELIFRNLIGNAIKHHHKPHTGHVWIWAREVNEFIEFRVTDDGPGIEPIYHERIFQMFQTLQPRDVVEGSGIGLAIVKRAVEHQKGSIQIESNLGEGTSVIFTWPRKPDTPSANPD